MRGLQKHSHEDRKRIIEELIPQIQKKFGDNLIALAATSSYARNEDFDYSDLELTAFVKTMPDGVRWDGIGKIISGLLIELVWMTKETYLAGVKDVSKDWYLAGSDRLFPLINKEFIDELINYQTENLQEKCLAQAARQWHEVQESTAKVLNAISAGNREGLPLLFFDMLRNMLISLSFLNQTPYVTFARFVTQAKNFEIKPADFEQLIAVAVDGNYQDLQFLQATVIAVFTQFEGIFDDFNINLYDTGFDFS